MPLSVQSLMYLTTCFLGPVQGVQLGLPREVEENLPHACHGGQDSWYLQSRLQTADLLESLDPLFKPGLTI